MKDFRVYLKANSGRKKLNFHIIIFFFCLLPTHSFGINNELPVLTAPVNISEYFPCSKCHEKRESVPVVKMEVFHTSIRIEGHIEDNYNCYGCHDIEYRDRLKLFNGSTIELSDSSRLCGQCHSTNFKHWQSGLHGKVVGNWNGPRKITPCTSCHNPHRPKYEGQHPAPSPTSPEQTLRWQK